MNIVKNDIQQIATIDLVRTTIVNNLSPFLRHWEHNIFWLPDGRFEFSDSTILDIFDESYLPYHRLLRSLSTVEGILPGIEIVPTGNRLQLKLKCNYVQSKSA